MGRVTRRGMVHRFYAALFLLGHQPEVQARYSYGSRGLTMDGQYGEAPLALEQAAGPLLA